MRNTLSWSLFSGFLCFALTISAQEIIPLEEGQQLQFYTFDEASYIQDEPFGEVIGTLPPGVLLQVEGIVDMTDVRGATDIWYEVSFNFQNRNRYGMVSSQHLALFALEGKKGELFLYQEAQQQQTAFRAVKNGEVMSTLTYERPKGDFQRPTGWSWQEGNHILTIPYAANCYPLPSKVFLAWNGKDLSYLGSSEQLGEVYD